MQRLEALAVPVPAPLEAPESAAPAASRPLAADTAAAVRRVIGGDADAFRTLIEAHEAAVFGLSKRLLYGDAAEAEDTTQDTFVRAYQYLARLEDPERFAPWLYQIARSLCRDRRRRLAVERRALAEKAEIDRSWMVGRPCGLDAEQGNGAVDPALDDLPEDERRALQLRYFDGLTYDEIAQRMRLTFSQVDHLIRHARARLARRVGVRLRRERG